LNNRRSAENIVNKWTEITLKNSRLLISAALKIIFFFNLSGNLFARTNYSSISNSHTLQFYSTH
jgi:hypothetical protein